MATALEIAGAIGAYTGPIVAGVALVISWRLRPLKIRSIETHSEQLKNTLQDWLKELKAPEAPGRGTGLHLARTYIDTTQSPQLYSLGIESDVLFRDMRHHLPKTMTLWADYKNSRDRYMGNKTKLTDSARILLNSCSGVRVHDASGITPDEDLVLHHAVEFVMQDLKELAVGRQPVNFPAALLQQPSEINELISKVVEIR
jgi:hypothetical protein